MEKMLVSIPNDLANRFRTIIPARQRSKVISHLIEIEIKRREKTLYECALALDKDSELNKEMSDWNTTIKDGLNDETW